MTLSDAIERYLLYREARGVAAGSIRTYDQTLRQALARIGNMRMKHITHQHVEQAFYGKGGLAETCQARTLNNHRSRLIGFFAWARAEGMMTADVMRTIPVRRVTKRDWLRLTPDQMSDIIEAAPNPRDRAALAIACNTGLRASSIADLRVGGLDLDAGELSYLNVKSRRERRQPITADLDREMRLWVRAYQEETGSHLNPDWYLVPARTNRFRPGCTGRSTARLIPDRKIARPSDIVHRALEAHGLDGKGEGFHTFRRSAARAVFEKGLAAGDPRAIYITQAFLDHDQATTTQLYLGTSHEQEKLGEILRGKPFLTRHPAGERSKIVDLAERRKGRTHG